MVGNPFRPFTIRETWRTWKGGIVRKIAQAIYDGRAFERLPMLADALEEAGCTDEAIRSHCRQPEGHFLGCWVLDAVLGKS